MEFGTEAIVSVAALGAAAGAALIALHRRGVSAVGWIVTNLYLPIYGRNNPKDLAGQRRAIAADRKAGPALPPKSLLKRFAIETTDGAMGRQYRVTSRGPRRSDAVILYFHGGAYVFSMVPPHWDLIAGLAERTGATVVVASYPLAPEHTWREGLAAADKAFDALAQEVGAGRIVIAGDSAGGGLTLALAQHRRDLGKPQAAGLILFCPWLDVTLSAPEQPAAARRDPMLRIDLLRDAGRMWAGPDDPGAPPVSPLFGVQEGLPPTLAFAGGRDVLGADVERLAARNPAVRTRLYPEMFHVWMAARIPEGARALQEAADFVAQIVANPARPTS